MKKFIAAFLATLTLAACHNPPAGHDASVPYDPYEADNRAMHEFNRKLDRAIVRPAGNGYVNVLPQPVRKGVSNFSSNLSLPGTIVNNLLQARLGEAAQNTLRFALNTTVGLGGLFDPSTELKLYEAEADFGETLHVWGFKEGAYVELPVLGPSTERDAAGKFVDLFTNPLSYVLESPDKYYGTGAALASKLGDRGEYAEVIDEVLYESADSYAQARTIYLQNRRFELGQDVSEASDIDPFALDLEGF